MRTTVTSIIVTGAIGLVGCGTSRPNRRRITMPALANALVPFHLSGVVTDEDGRPLAGAEVGINGVIGVLLVRVTYTSTDAEGRYEVDFNAIRNGYRGVVGLTDIVALGYARVGSGEHEKDLRFFTSSTSTVRGDFRLDRRVRLAPDDSSTVTFRPDDSVCDGDAASASMSSAGMCASLFPLTEH